MSVLCKMQCHTSPVGDQINDMPQKVSFGAVYYPDEAERAKSENAIFGKATPWGSIEMGIANPAAKKFFQPGKKYYVTFTEAPD